MYEEFVYLLDLCILSYQLHAQTLIWPLDPYYEFSGDKTKRNKFMDALRGFGQNPTSTSTSSSTSTSTSSSDLHGPGSCQGRPDQGWGTNNSLDPIFADYTRIYPWRPSFTRSGGQKEPWIVYQAPTEITDCIGKVCMVHYNAGSDGPESNHPRVILTTIHSEPPDKVRGKDLLYCFEGGTGAVYGVKSDQQYASWSMMGFVLATADAPTTTGSADYDVYVVFRGSHSGKLDPEKLYAKSMDATGNPDWVTDLQWKDVVEDPEIWKEISKYGSCSKGFMASIKSMLPTVMRCLQSIHADKKQKPRTIYVTGHSLGGALASHFTSAMVLGSKYGEKGQGQNMPAELRSWPWHSVRLVTFSAPVVGEKRFGARFDAVCPSNRVCVTGDKVPTEIANERCIVGLATELSPPPQIIEGLNPHDPLAVRKSLIWWLQTNFPQTLPGKPKIPMTDQPSKMFTSTSAVLTHLSEYKQLRTLWAMAPLRAIESDDEQALLVMKEIKQQFSDMIPDHDDFLRTLEQNFKQIYAGEQEVLNEFATLMANVVGAQGARGGRGGGDDFRAFQQTIFLMRDCVRLREKHKSVYDLIGLCFLFSALRKDSSLCLDLKRFETVNDCLKTIGID